MNKIRQIIGVLTGCIIIAGFIYSCSDNGEKHREGMDVFLEKYSEKESNIKETPKFYEALNDISQKGHEKDSKGPEITMHTMKPEDGGEGYYRIGDCFLTLPVDVDGDKKKEKICLRYLKYKEHDDSYTSYISLVVDLFKNKKHVLRQELDREFLFEERFVSFKDINSDGTIDLITKGRLSSHCTGCSSYRIYTFKEGRFDLVLNLFNIDPDNPSLNNVLAKLSDFEGIILSEYKKRAKTEHPCGVYNSCVESVPWAVDLNHDGLSEVILPVRAPEDTDPFSGKTYNIFIAKFTKDGKLTNCKFHMIDYKCYSWACGVDVLGFLETSDKRVHLLINYDYPGNSPAVPELNIFDIHSNHLKNIGKFDGFYEDAKVERFRDIDGDGNTEIIYVGDTYWPPGKSHAFIIPIYGIAEYRNGRYIEDHEKFKSTLKRLNKLK